MFDNSIDDNSIFVKGNWGYNAPMDFKLIPEGDNSAVSRKKTLHFLNVRNLSRVKKDLDMTVNFVFISLKSENRETSAVVK